MHDNNTNNETKTFQIPDVFMYRLETHVEKLQQRARKLNLTPIEIVELSRIEHNVEGVVFDVLTIEILGVTPKLNGWEFVATIDHGLTDEGDALNIIRALPDKNVPARFRTTAKICEHCNANRTRKNTYIVHNENTHEWKQVGSSCLRDYVGHKDAQRVAAYLNNCIEFFEMLLSDDLTIDEAIAELFAHPRGGGSMNVEPRYDLTNFLRLTARAIHAFGWTSKGKAHETDRVATVYYVIDALFDSMAGNKRNVLSEMKQPLPNEKELVENTLAWVTSLTDDDLTNDYLYNLYAIAMHNDITYKGFGIAASMISAYQRVIAEKQAREQQPISEHFGEIKKRYTFDHLELVREHAFEGRYGTTYIFNFVDEAGNVFVWFTGNYWYEVGKTYIGKATIKDHDVYRDVKQTIITRAKFDVIDENGNVEQQPKGFTAQGQPVF